MHNEDRTRDVFHWHMHIQTAVTTAYSFLPQRSPFLYCVREADEMWCEKDDMNLGPDNDVGMIDDTTECEPLYPAVWFDVLTLSAVYRISMIRQEMYFYLKSCQRLEDSACFCRMFCQFIFFYHLLLGLLFPLFSTTDNYGKRWNLQITFVYMEPVI